MSLIDIAKVLKQAVTEICMASQVHINSLNLSLNFKQRFENLKPRFKNFKPRFEEKVHINSLNQGLKFQTGVLAGQMHINSLNLSLNFKPRFKNFKPRFERKSAHQFFKPGFEVSNRGFSWPNAH